MVAEPLSLNRYTYATGNPLRYFDPDGHMRDPSSCKDTGSCVPYSSPALDADASEAHRLASQTSDSEAQLAEQRALGAADRRAQHDYADLNRCASAPQKPIKPQVGRITRRSA